MKNGHTDVGILPIGNVNSWEHYVGDDVTSIQGFTSSFTVEVSSFIPLKSDASGRFLKMVLFLKVQQVLLKLLDCHKLTGFLIRRIIA